MKYSNLYVKTQKETPSGEDSKNAELLIKAGFIRKEVAGAYSFLPLGLRVLRKIENIVREEMNKIDAIEILMPALASKEHWTTTDRWDHMDCLYKLETAAGHEVALAPTHEETVTPLIQQFARSWKDFPLCTYQIQTKFRNEARAKSGLLRGREFLMKDAYSFHTSQEDFDRYYEVQKEAYGKIYERLGLGDITHVVAASGGDFSKHSHEFQTECVTGEDTVFYSKKKDLYLNREIVESIAPKVSYEVKEELPLKEVEGKGIIGVEDLCKFLGVIEEQTTKTLFFTTDTGEFIASAVRGNYSINELKLKDAVGCKSLVLASEEKVKEMTGAEIGYAGILNLPKEIKVFMDESMDNRSNFEMGANKTDHHTININWERDLQKPDKFYDIKIAKEEDLDPETGEKYEVFKAIEVGNIFPLSTKFTKAFNFGFIDATGKSQPILMGCYGIGISRIMGAIAEIFYDDKGLKWPKLIAPFQVYLAAIGKDEKVYKEAENLYEELNKAGIEVLYDDRQDKKIGPGQKFADHELLGIPCRLVMSENTTKEGVVEFVDRETGKVEKIKRAEVVEFLKK